jgi:hypothetical protein
VLRIYHTAQESLTRVAYAELESRVKVPEFESEAQEAAWWDAHRDEVEENLVQAMRGGTVETGAARRSAQEARLSKNIAIRMPGAEL